MSALSLIIFVLLNSAGNTEARPTNISQSNISKETHAVEWLGKLEDPNSVGGQESGIEAEKLRLIQLHTHDKDTIEWLEKRENQKPDKQEDGIQEASGVGETDIKEKETAQNPSSVRKARNTSNACIERYEYRIFYNQVFKIAVCKSGCKQKVKFFQFPNGQSLTFVYDCYK